MGSPSTRGAEGSGLGGLLVRWFVGCGVAVGSLSAALVYLILHLWGPPWGMFTPALGLRKCLWKEDLSLGVVGRSLVPGAGCCSAGA